MYILKFAMTNRKELPMKLYTPDELAAKKAAARNKGAVVRDRHNLLAQATAQRVSIAAQPVVGYVFGVSAPEPTDIGIRF